MGKVGGKLDALSCELREGELGGESNELMYKCGQSFKGPFLKAGRNALRGEKLELR